VCTAHAASDSGAATTVARQVGPHRFPVGLGVPDPFLSTFVFAATGIASTQGLEIELLDFQDPPQPLGTKAVSLQYLTQTFQFQQHVGDRAAVRLGIAASGRLGTETTALLTEGISVIMGWGLGGTLQLAERPGFLLSGSLDVGSNGLTAISLRSFVEDVLANGFSDTTKSLAEDYSNLQVSTGLRAAWGRSTMTGYLLYGDVGFQEPYDDDKDTEAFVKLGGMVSLDMRERWEPDIGFAFGANYRSDSSRNEDLSSGGWDARLGIFYTGRAEFTVGLQTIYTRLEQSTADGDFNAIGATIVLRYDFF
jgi:hypothetical protein